MANNGSNLNLINSSNDINEINVPSNFNLYPVNEAKVYLYWDKTDASYYKIYRKFNSNIVFLDSTYSNNYYDLNLVKDSTYYYAISAVDLSQ